MTTLVFVAVVQGDLTQGYTARLPDLPGVTARGAAMGDLMADVRAEILSALESLSRDGLDWPIPVGADDVTPQDDGRIVFVDVTVDDAPQRVNISIGERLLGRIDQAAEAQGLSRSAFIASAARAALGERGSQGRFGDFETMAKNMQTEWSALSRKLSDAMGADSAFDRSMSDFDDKVTAAVRRAAEGVSAAMARRGDTDRRKDDQTKSDGADPATAV